MDEPYCNAMTAISGKNPAQNQEHLTCVLRSSSPLQTRLADEPAGVICVEPAGVICVEDAAGRLATVRRARGRLEGDDIEDPDGDALMEGMR